jgi:hypothetical protein
MPGRSVSPNWLKPMSTDEMIACLGSCRARADLAAMIEALLLHPSLNTPVETKRLEAARRDGELEGLQPRLPGPAQRAPSAPWLPLNRTSLVISAHHRADSSGSGLGIFPIGDSRAFKAETGFPPHSRKCRPRPSGGARKKGTGG